MTNEKGQEFTDSFAVGMNLHYHKLLKYLLAVPFAFMIVMVSWLKLDPAGGAHATNAGESLADLQ